MVIVIVRINGHSHKIQHEGLHIICGKCGCYNHYTRKCVIDSTQISISVAPEQLLAQTTTGGHVEQHESEKAVGLMQKGKEETRDINSETLSQKKLNLRPMGIGLWLLERKEIRFRQNKVSKNK